MAHLAKGKQRMDGSVGQRKENDVTGGAVHGLTAAAATAAAAAELLVDAAPAPPSEPVELALTPATVGARGSGVRAIKAAHPPWPL